MHVSKRVYNGGNNFTKAYTTTDFKRLAEIMVLYVLCVITSKNAQKGMKKIICIFALCGGV